MPSVRWQSGMVGGVAKNKCLVSIMIDCPDPESSSEGLPVAETDLFKWRHYESEIILLCVRWYLRYALSYRDLEEMMRERGLSLDHTTIYGAADVLSEAWVQDIRECGNNIEWNRVGEQNQKRAVRYIRDHRPRDYGPTSIGSRACSKMRS